MREVRRRAWPRAGGQLMATTGRCGIGLLSRHGLEFDDNGDVVPSAEPGAPALSQSTPEPDQDRSATTSTVSPKAALLDQLHRIWQGRADR